VGIRQPHRLTFSPILCRSLPPLPAQSRKAVRNPAEPEVNMTNVLQPAPPPAEQSTQPVLRSQPAALEFDLSRNQTKARETGRLFFMSSLFDGLCLFNILIINSLNKQKTRNTPF
jgi:hypothetical protein